MNERHARLLDLIQQGLLDHQALTVEKQLGDRTSYLGLSDVAAFVLMSKSSIIAPPFYKKRRRQ